MTDRSGPAWLALGLGLVVAWFSIRAQEPPPAQPSDAPPDVFSAGRAMKLVEEIARESHPMGSEANAKVRQMLVEKLKGLGIEAEVQERREGDQPERNIVARVDGRGPRGKKAVLICAHYDSSPNGPGAGDNASGVSAILESLRALEAGPPPERDLIILIDDGEERGLLGARLFVEEHRWAKEVGVVLNFDARGNHGPSIMFETSARNGWLIRQFAEASPHPVATSLSMDIYRLMPNDTNLTIFKNAGLDGLNFAFSRGLSYYHSADDTPANLDPRTLQHQGENLLALARHFGQIGLEDVRGDDVVYFSVLSRKVFFYPITLAMPAALAAAGLFVLTVMAGVGTRRARLSDLIVGLAIWPLVALAAIFATAGFWIILRDMGNSFGLPLLRFAVPILSACSVVAAVVSLALIRRLTAGRALEATSLGALAWGVALAIGSARYLPGASYLFTWPCFFTLLGLELSMPIRRGSSWALVPIFLGVLPTLVMGPPLMYDAFEGLNLRLCGPLMIVVVLFLGAILPLLGPIVASKRPA